MLEVPDTTGAFEIGGPEVLTYLEMMRRVAAIEGRTMLVVPVPLLTPRLSSRWLALVTDVDVQTGRSLIDSMSNEVVVHDDSIRSLVPFEPLAYDDAVLALSANGRSTHADDRTRGPHQRRGAAFRRLCGNTNQPTDSTHTARSAPRHAPQRGDCPDCGAASGHWPSCPRYPLRTDGRADGQRLGAARRCPRPRFAFRPAVSSPAVSLTAARPTGRAVAARRPLGLLRRRPERQPRQHGHLLGERADLTLQVSDPGLQHDVFHRQALRLGTPELDLAHTTEITLAHDVGTRSLQAARVQHPARTACRSTSQAPSRLRDHRMLTSKLG